MEASPELGSWEMLKGWTTADCEPHKPRFSPNKHQRTQNSFIDPFCLIIECRHISVFWVWAELLYQCVGHFSATSHCMILRWAKHNLHPDFNATQSLSRFQSRIKMMNDCEHKTGKNFLLRHIPRLTQLGKLSSYSTNCCVIRLVMLFKSKA